MYRNMTLAQTEHTFFIDSIEVKNIQEYNGVNETATESWI